MEALFIFKIEHILLYDVDYNLLYRKCNLQGALEKCNAYINRK